MSIPKAAFEQILKEYDGKQLKAQRMCRLKTGQIESEIPQLSEINSQIAELSVNLAIMRIKGTAPDIGLYNSRMDELVSRKEELLRAAGYTPADLEPQYECPQCRDTGYVDNRMCRCLRSRLIEVLYDQSNIKEVLEKENFRNYSLKYYSSVPVSGDSDESPLTVAKKAVAAAREFVKHFKDSSDNLFISGGTGVGKTFLSNCVAKELIDRGYSVIYLSAVRLFNILAGDTFGNSRDQEMITGHLYSCDLLIIDDLGTEYTNLFVQSAFFNCINERLLRRKHTIISTNLSLEQIRNNYSERVFSRIAEKYILIKLFGEDIRMLKKLEV